MKSEFEFINALRARKSKVQSPKSKVRFGIGDDCAVINQNDKTDLVITTDLLIEDVDFRLDWTTPEFIGHKALAVSLSDVAAMGAKPVWAMVSIGVPQKIWRSRFVEKFYAGWFELAEKFNVELVGGDVSRTPDKIVIDSIVAGAVEKNCAVMRSGARVGDLIMVTGKLGAAAAGLRLLENGERFDPAVVKSGNLFRRQLTPTPQVKIGAKLGKLKLASAMIDLSDGLSSDLRHLCEASKVGARIYADKIPLAKSVRRIAGTNQAALEFALDGGEDFELLFTVPKKKHNKILRKFDGISHIGEITESVENIQLISESGTILLHPKGFQHFT